MSFIDSCEAWREGDFADDCRRWRPMAGALDRMAGGARNRRARFRGVEKNGLGLSLRIAAIKLRRLVNIGWITTAAGSCTPL